jgi:CBS domain-containing protein
MKARDVMVSPVITVKLSASVREVAETLLKHRISAVPVVDDQGKLVGIVSEGDLMHRSESDTERRRSWWLLGLTRDEVLANEYVKSRGRRVADVMTRDVITTEPGTPLHAVAALLEKNAVKRVPVVENGALVGIVSRANLVQAVASARKALDIPLSDNAIRDRLLAHLNQQAWVHTSMLNVTVTDGVVDIWGCTDSDAERKATRVAAETAQGVNGVNDNLVAFRVHGWS